MRIVARDEIFPVDAYAVIIVKYTELGRVVDIDFAVDILQPEDGVQVRREHIDPSIRMNAKDSIRRRIRRTAHVIQVLSNKYSAVRRTAYHRRSADSRSLSY